VRYREIGDGRVSLTVSDICLGVMNFGYRTDKRTGFEILDR
jgi:aryl-alcohol dehydrogenase-like predicted oxidoreductase